VLIFAENLAVTFFFLPIKDVTKSELGRGEKVEGAKREKGYIRQNGGRSGAAPEPEPQMGAVVLVCLSPSNQEHGAFAMIMNHEFLMSSLLSRSTPLPQRRLAAAAAVAERGGGGGDAASAAANGCLHPFLRQAT